MDLLQVYNAVHTILDTIDFSALLAGFHPYRFALYTSEMIVIDGKSMPYEEDFRGNTSILYEDEYVAIWNMEDDPVEDPERLAYLLVHEMFHCHQYTHKEARFPSDLTLLNYPDDIENFTKKYNENRYLADAFARKDREALRKFTSIRERRYQTYSAMVRQEWKVETIEGMAEYIGLKALSYIDSAKYHVIVQAYLAKLQAEGDLLFDIRRISYYTGAIYFLCLERLGLPIRHTFDSEQTVYEQNRIDSTDATVEIVPYAFVEGSYQRLQQEKKAKVEAHMQNASYISCDAEIYGYDPMNMFRIGDIVYCSHFVLLKKNDNLKMIDKAVALQLAEGTDQTIVGYYLVEQA